jgi:membrane-bound serine protease (ClpP class)
MSNARGKVPRTGATLWSALALIVGLLLTQLAPAPAQESGRKILIVEVTGVIGVATTLHVEKGLEQAKRENAELVILRVDTPGGLVSSTREMVQMILASPVPVVGFVAPSGAHAASAGTFIIAATHVAAMAPGTQIGAATPIAIGAPPMPGQQPQPEKDKDEKKEGEGQGGTEGAADRKALNDTIAFIRSLGQMRGRNVEWLEKAVREAATLTGEDAVKENVVEILANNTEDLVQKLDGREIVIAGVARKLATAGATVTTVEMGFRTKVLSAIADPNVAFILLMIGVYGILFEFWNPGAVAPGVVGGICLLLALTALTSLPLNFAGLALILFGIALMVVEAFTPSFGVMGIGGIAAFVVGALFLFDPEGSDVDVQVALPVIVGAALTSIAVMTFIVGFAVSAHRRKVVSGGEEMIGAKGEVVEWQDTKGAIRVHGEVWSAAGDRSFNRGDAVVVKERRGLVLIVVAA